MPTSQRIIWIGMAVAAAAILALGYFLFLAPRAEPAQTTLLKEPAAAPAAIPQDAAEIDHDPGIVPLDLDLENSDTAVRDLAGKDGLPEALRAGLRQKDIVRTVVAAVDRVARGESPAPLLPFLSPAEPLRALDRGGRLVLDPLSYRRYEPLAAAFAAIPDRTWVFWYRTLRPTLEKAFRELGYPGLSFDLRLRQAAEHLLLTPAVAGDVVLERKLLSYAFADPALEGLSAAQKHLLRLGAENAAQVRGKLRALLSQLGEKGKG